MFTGIVEELGSVAALDWHGEAAVLRIRGPLVTTDAAEGDSIAVSGVCLTVVSVQGDEFTADVMVARVGRVYAEVRGGRANLDHGGAPEQAHA